MAAQHRSLQWLGELQFCTAPVLSSAPDVRVFTSAAVHICALHRPVSHTYAPATHPARLPAGGGAAPGGQKPSPIDFSKQPNDGYFLVARALARLGVRHMFGVIGIPVTQLASGGVQLSISYEMVVGERVEQLLCPVCPEQAPSLHGSQPHQRKAVCSLPRPAAVASFMRH